MARTKAKARKTTSQRPPTASHQGGSSVTGQPKSSQSIDSLPSPTFQTIPCTSPNPFDNSFLSQDLNKSESANESLSSRGNSPLTAFWDFEQCPLSEKMRDGEIVTALRNYSSLHTLYAIGDTEILPETTKKHLQGNGVIFLRVFQGTKGNSSDFAILSELFKFVMDHPPPHQILLITGQRDFSSIVSTLRNRRYEITLVLNPRNYSEAMVAAGKESLTFYWDEFIACEGKNVPPLSLSQLKPPYPPLRPRVRPNVKETKALPGESPTENKHKKQKTMEEEVKSEKDSQETQKELKKKSEEQLSS